MKFRLIFALPVLLLLASFAFPAETVFWLRGSDAATFADGNYYYLMSTSPPNASSHKTAISRELAIGTGELARWYSLSYPSSNAIEGKIYLWLKKSVSDGISLRFVLYDFKEGESRLAASSGWEKSSDSLLLSSENISYPLPSGHSIKLVLEYSSDNGKTISFSLDEPSSAPGTYAWKTPSGSEYYLQGVESTAALLFSSCPSIKCSSDSECDDLDALTADKCLNPGTCNSACSNQGCAQNCKSDSACDDSNPLTLDTCEDKGSCTAFCTNRKCTPKCSSSNGCNEKEGGYCLYPGTCLSSCEYSKCQARLPVGIGECSKYICKEGIWSIEPMADCCGNGICEYPEQEICRADCASNRLEIEIPGFQQGQYFARGEKISLRLKVKRNGAELKDAVVKSLIPGNLKLVFDSNNGIYSKEIEVPASAGNIFGIPVNAEQGADSALIIKNFIVAPVLSVDASLNKEKYLAGEELTAKGKILRKGQAVEAEILFSVFCGSSIIYETSEKASDFSFSYRTAALVYCDNPKILISAEDSYGNKGSFEKAFSLELPVNSEPLEITVEGIKGEYRRGGNISLQAKVYSKGKEVEGAHVQLALPNGENLVFREENGGYLLSTSLPYDVPIGMQEFRVSAVKINGAIYKGIVSVKTSITQSEIIIELLGNSFSPNKAELSFSFFYPDKSPLTDFNSTLLINGSNYEILKVGGTTYVSEYPCNENCALNIQLFLADSYGNYGKFEKKITPGFFLPEGMLNIILGFSAVLLAIILAFYYINLRRKGTKLLKEREQRLLKDIESLQRRYFVEGSMNRELYYKTINQYNTELNDVKSRLRGSVNKK